MTVTVLLAAPGVTAGLLRAADLGACDVAHFIRMRGIGSPKVKLSLT